MNAAAAKRAKTQPVYLRCEKLIRPETGELVRAWVANTEWDAKAMQARKYHVETVVRADMRKPRNIRFHRLAHALGGLVVENVEGFEALDAHDALKRLQRESGLFCEIRMMDASPVISAILAATESLLGAKARKLLASVLPDIKVIPVTEARSLAFDELDEGDFNQLVHGLCAHIRKHYLGVPNEELELILHEIESGAA